jgi:RimJ/RimL family protein N-acetyltransferase
MEVNEVKLETERLVLRWFREEDFPAYVEIATDAEVMKFIGGQQTQLEAWRAMTSHIGHWYFRGYGVFAVEEKASRRMVGRVGFMNPPGWPGFELGWTLARSSWGKGYATEAARRLMRYAFTEMNRDHLISCIAPDNVSSVKVAERLGETVEGETELLGKRVLLYGISREQWKRNQPTE